jgi:hypothetical protein
MNMQRNQSSTRWVDGAPDDREPLNGEDRLGQAQRVPDDEVDDGDREIGVAHRPNPLPLREEEEEELSEADIMEELDMTALDADDLAKMEGPDA